MVGYSLVFAPGDPKHNNEIVGGAEKIWFWGYKDEHRLAITSMAGTIPESVYIMFQMTFAIFTACIAAGSFAERMKFSSMLVFFFLWHCLVYCPVAHWVWGAGFLRRWGVLDFAGGNVVHIVSGVTGVIGSKILGPRMNDFTVRSDQTVLLTFIGGSLLWIGWFGFNAGSAISAGGQAGMAMLVTHVCASTCGFTWMCIEWMRSGQPTVVGVVSGAITGLVLITPAAGFVDQTGAFFMGLFGAILCYGLVVVKNTVGLDEKPNVQDYPDAFGVHAVGGIVGGILTAFFANPLIGGATGIFYGENGWKLLGWQLAGIGITVVFAAVMTALIMLVLKFTIGINNPTQHQEKAPEPFEVFPVAPMVPMHPLQPVMPMMQMVPQQYGFPGMSPQPMVMGNSAMPMGTSAMPMQPYGGF